ncbi:MAG: protein translocase subunit SecF [Candidatus Marinimicrobia bacterium]|nr:protein translocase subunit SecF [Candidatus Neomarinimicrobiota bacterium]
MIQFFKNPNYDIIGKRKITAIISILIILAGIVSILIQGLHYGIDFEGGTLMQLKFKNNTTAGELRELLKNPELGTPVIQESAENEYMIRVKSFGTENIIIGKIKDDLKDRNFEVRRVEKVGPKIGEELKTSAILAIFVSMLLILIYISVRFEFKFAVGAVIALFHDVLITLGIFSIFQWEFSMPVLAAFLTIVGYSLNDTIVVYDRIREDSAAYRNTKSFSEIINLSINQSLSRTVITSLTTFLVVFILVIYGGEALFGFAIAMLIGVVVGTYSSAFVAAPLLIYWEEKINTTKSKKKLK